MKLWDSKSRRFFTIERWSPEKSRRIGRWTSKLLGILFPIFILLFFIHLWLTFSYIDHLHIKLDKLEQSCKVKR